MPPVHVILPPSVVDFYDSLLPDPLRLEGFSFLGWQLAKELKIHPDFSQSFTFSLLRLAVDIELDGLHLTFYLRYDNIASITWMTPLSASISDVTTVAFFNPKAVRAVNLDG